MQCICPKYTSKFICIVISSAIILSCVPKHKFDLEKNKLTDKKMAVVLADVFLMETYVSEKLSGAHPDSLAAIKLSFYKKILKHHNVDSVSFYSTFNYLQAHPADMARILTKVDTVISRIKPGDLTPMEPEVNVPAGIEKLPGFPEQERAMGAEYLKKLRQRLKDSIKNNSVK
jgi:hypothetical protein